MDKKVRVLQCGFPRSGNYRLYRAIRAVMEEEEMFFSYKQLSGIAEVIGSLCGDFTFVPDMGVVDSFYYRDGRFLLEFPHPSCRFVEVDGRLLFNTSTLLWTHEKADIVKNPLLDNITHRFYVLRDGRDVVNSIIHHVTRKEMLAIRPEYKYKKAEHIYADTELFKHYVRQWREHVRSYIENKDSFICLRFEDFIAEPVKTIERIASALGIRVKADRIAEVVSFSNLSKYAPSHLRRGRIGDWQDYFSKEHTKIFMDIAGEELVELGYCEDSNSYKGGLDAEKLGKDHSIGTMHNS